MTHFSAEYLLAPTSSDFTGAEQDFGYKKTFYLYKLSTLLDSLNQTTQQVRIGRSRDSGSYGVCSISTFEKTVSIIGKCFQAELKDQCSPWQ